MLTLLVAGLVSSLAGWLAAGVWQAGQDREERLAGLTAAAVVVDVRPSGGTPVRTAADLVVRISNLGRAPLTLSGGEASFDAGSILGVTPVGLTVNPGNSGLAVVHAAVACASPQPLRLPALQLRDADSRIRSVIIDGSAQALGRVCDLLSGSVHQLDLVSVSPDGDRLRLLVSSPTGRTAQILGISARGVPLPGRPIPGMVEPPGTTVWIDPPASCPPEWLASGIPRTVDIQLDSGGPSSVTLDLGFALVRWLRSGSCAGADR